MQNFTMSEIDFFHMCDVMDVVEPLDDKYFPTVEEMNRHNVPNNILDFLPMLIYFSNDPLKDEEMSDERREKYQESVKFIKKLVYNIDLE